MRNEVTGKMPLKTQKCDSVQGTFTSLFGLDKSRHLVGVEVEQKPFNFKGYISTEAHSNKQLQYIYINGRIVLTSRIHKVVGWILQKRSVICRRKGVGKQIVGRDYSPNSSPPNQPQRHGVYVLNLECPLNEYDITFDPRKTLVEFKDWTSVLKLLKDLVYNFLRHNNLLAQEDNYMGNSDRCTFTDPMLQEVLVDDSQESQDAVKDAQSSTSDLVISSENTVGNLLSKTVRRKSCTLSCSAGSVESPSEETQSMQNVPAFDAVVCSKDLCSINPPLESDILGAQLTAASRGARLKAVGKGDSSAFSQNNDKVNFTDPQSLNTMLATASYEKGSQIRSSPSVAKVLITEIPQTEFTNGSATLTQLFEGQNSQGTGQCQNTGKREESEISGTASSMQNHHVVSNTSENKTSGVSESATSSSRIPISLPPQQGRLSSMAMFREDMKRKCASCSSESAVKEPKTSKLTGLQKIRAKMMSSSHRGLESSSVQRTANKIEAIVESDELMQIKRQTRSYSSDDTRQQIVKISDTSFNITNLRKLAEKMRGQAGRRTVPERIEKTTASSEHETMESTIQSDIFIIGSCTRMEVSSNKKYINSTDCRKRSADNESMNCDENIPCKSTKTNSYGNLGKGFKQHSVNAENSDMYSSDPLSSPSYVVAPRRTFITTESFLQSIHDVPKIEMLPEGTDCNYETQSSGALTRESLSNEPDFEDINKSIGVKKFDFTGQHKVTNNIPIQDKLHNIGNTDRESLCAQKAQTEGDGISKSIESVQTTAAKILLTESKLGAVLAETKVIVNTSREKQSTVSASTEQPENPATNKFASKTDGRTNNQIDHGVVSVPFQPTISGDFCVEFFPMKFECCKDYRHDTLGTANTTTACVTDSSTKNASSGPSEKCSSLSCSQGFKTTSTEFQGFELDFVTSTQPFGVTSEDDHSTPQIKDNFNENEEKYDHIVVNNSDSLLTDTYPRKEKSGSSEEAVFKRPSLHQSEGEPFIKSSPRDNATSVNINTLNAESCALKIAVDFEKVSDSKEPEKDSHSGKKSNTEQSATMSGMNASNEKKAASLPDTGPRVIFTSGSWICQIDPNTGIQNEFVFCEKIIKMCRNVK